MKAINLKTLIDSYESLSQSILSSYLSIYGIRIAEKGKNDGIKAHEFDAIKSFVSQFDDKESRMSLLDNFYVGYKIPQIPKEFDLLRINKDSVVNVELKSEANEEKILTQLRRNEYYLKFLDKRIVLFTYVQNTNTLYQLNQTGCLETTTFDVLSDELLKENREIGYIDSLFNPSNYLVSPFNNTEKFIENEYFLTNQQEEIEAQIFKVLNSPKFEIVALTGSAGTGKTLLTYDIAKKLRERRKEVLILHCGKLNEGQQMLRDRYKWNICQAKYIKKDDLCKYRVVIVDESQRVHKRQFDLLVTTAKEQNLKILFSYDEKQYLRNEEKSIGISDRVSALTQMVFKLTDKIRTNKEIASFIVSLFDSQKNLGNIEYPNIDIYYCSTAKDVIALSKSLLGKGWKVPIYTPGIYSAYRYQVYGVQGEDSAHSVIGQEFDKVVAVIDDTFKYDDSGQLIASNPYYSQRQMLYQILTRVRLKLSIIILNNEPMLERCLKILGR